MAALILDAASIRAELEEAPSVHGLTVDQATVLRGLGDEELEAALVPDNTFWEAHDSVRREAIARLCRERGMEADAWDE